MKDNYVVGKKWPEMIAKVPNAKVVLFISNQSLRADKLVVESDYLAKNL